MWAPSGTERRQSPLEHVSFDAAPDVTPGLEHGHTRLDRCHAALDLRGAQGFGVGIGGAVEAGEQLGSQFGSGVLVQPQGLGQDVAAAWIMMRS